jgi:hypothetical protein
MEVQRQLDDMVMREAGELLKQTVDDELGELIADALDSLQRLNDGIQRPRGNLRPVLRLHACTNIQEEEGRSDAWVQPGARPRSLCR